MNAETPLVYTSKGNLPMADLEYKVGWEDSPDNTVFWEEYWLGEEMVKRAAHVYAKKGLFATGEASSFPT